MLESTTCKYCTTSVLISPRSRSYLGYSESSRVPHRSIVLVMQSPMFCSNHFPSSSTSVYHADCANCNHSVTCCLESRAIWARHTVEAYDNSIDQLCSKASSVKAAAAGCESLLKQSNPSNDIADLLRCEASCKYTAYEREPICGSNYK